MLQLARARHGCKVEDRADWRRHGNAVTDRAIGVVEVTYAVYTNAPPPPVQASRHDDVRNLREASGGASPVCRRGAETKMGMSAAREDGSHFAGMSRRDRSDEIHAAVQDPQTAGLYPPAYRAGLQADLQELCAAYDAMLAPGQVADPVFDLPRHWSHSRWRRGG